MGINSQRLAKQKFKAQKSAFLKKGIVIAIISGILYGCYSAFLTQGMMVGIWAEWYGYVPTTIVLSTFVATYVLGAVGCAVNDSCAAIAMLIISAFKGTLGDVFRCIKTKPGALMIAAALAGGPIANTAYVIALTMAGPIAAAISALCAPCGAVIGRVFLKQELNLRMVCGIIICFGAGCVLSGTTFDVANMTAFIGMMIAFIAALGWGFEGAIGGYGVCMMDYQIGITIREITSSLSNIIIMVPVLSLIGLAFGGSGIGEGYSLLADAFTDGTSVVWIAAAGTCCGLSFALWYKGNSMCGAALGMTCNAMYSFWTPLICWILMGLILGQDGWMLSPIQWLMAVVIVIGIFLIAMDPRDLFKKEED